MRLLVPFTRRDVGAPIIWVFIIVIMLNFTGCGFQAVKPAPVSDLGGSKARIVPGVAAADAYVVQKGDTLYSIAWRVNLSVSALQAINHLPSDGKIRIGQRLQLRASGVRLAKSAAVDGKLRCCLKKDSSVSESSIKSDISIKSSDWMWPARGELVGRYLSKGGLNKGIDIQLKLGEPVVAALDGLVVYAGSGLRDYGNLVILKHADNFLSAYGNNQQLLVREGERVRVGQKIALVSSGVMLHFEIRYDGQPVDPLRYLPPRAVRN